MHGPPSHEPLPPPLPGEAFALEPDGVGGLRVYRDGPDDGPPVVLVHSVNAAGTAFEVRPLYERLARSRATYAFDLPGFGLSERSERRYTPRLMTDALAAVVEAVRARHAGEAVDALALSLSCEFLARAASEGPAAYRTVSLVSPTGFDGRGRRDGPPGSTRAMPWLRSLLGASLWDDALFRGLTKPGVVRYFLERTWGAKDIDEDLWAYDVKTARQPGAKHAPLDFLGGYLFSKDVTPLYESLAMPVWVSHGVRGDFVDYRGVDAVRSRDNWDVTVFQTGALPHFEVPDEFAARYLAFLGAAGA